MKKRSPLPQPPTPHPIPTLPRGRVSKNNMRRERNTRVVLTLVENAAVVPHPSGPLMETIRPELMSDKENDITSKNPRNNT